MIATKRPEHIYFCVYAFIGTVIISILDFGAQWVGVSRQDIEILNFGNFIIGTVIACFFVWFIFHRKNWARIIYSILTLIAIPGAISIIIKEASGDLIGAISSSSQLVLGLISIAFLYSRQSRNWFNASKQNR